MAQQLSLDFSAIARNHEQTYPIAYLEQASKTYSADKISEANKIRGIFYHLGMPHVCTGTCYKWGIDLVWLTRLYSLSEWELMPEIADPPYQWGQQIQYRNKTYIMGDRIILEPHPREREIQIAKSKIESGNRMISRAMPYASKQKIDLLWGVEHYLDEIRKAKSWIREGQLTLESYGVLQM